MRYLRANTQVIVTIGPFVDVGDGFTPETGITLGAADEAELLKHGSTSVVDIAAATWAAVTSADGHYSLTLTTSHTDTEGLLRIIIQDDSVCLPVKEDFMVLSEAAWDSMFVAKDDGFMDVNIKTIGRADTQETEASNLESACSNYSATRGLTGTAVPAAAADAAGGLVISDAGGFDVDNRAPSATSVTNMNTVFATDFAANYNTTNDGWVVKLGDYAHGGSSANTTLGTLTTGAVSVTTLASSGTVTLNALTVTNVTTLSGAVSLGSTLGVTGTTTFAAINTGAIAATTLATSGTTTLNALTVTNATTLSGAVTASHASNNIKLGSTEDNAIADALLDRTDAVETAITPRLAFRYIAAACCGKLSGAGTATETFDGIAVNTDRMVSTVDASGNRTAITLS